jgi:hypothetical protein
LRKQEEAAARKVYQGFELLLKLTCL